MARLSFIAFGLIFSGIHDLAIKGDTLGSVVLAQGEEDAADVKYEITIRSDRKNTLETVRLKKTPATSVSDPAGSHCMELE